MENVQRFYYIGEEDGIILGKIWAYGEKMKYQQKSDSLLLPVNEANLNKNLKARNSLLKGYSKSDLA